MVAGNSFDPSTPTIDWTPVGHGLQRWSGMARNGSPKLQEDQLLDVSPIVDRLDHLSRRIHHD
jgi:tetrahydromethanopterin S-methyltransferase subunit B